MTKKQSLSYLDKRRSLRTSALKSLPYPLPAVNLPLTGCLRPFSEKALRPGWFHV
ncbi:hypothetical protein [Eubacterium callanderi]|uniref:hypothetical protein n=1 Tax=Eubacterium callanderi TaxID=53442 RepID=UPI001356699B